MASISSQLIGKNAGQRNAIKVVALETAASKVLPVSYSFQGVDIRVESIGVEDEMLKIVATATKDGKALPVNNPLYYVNPPIMVPDGTTRQAVIDGILSTISNFKEDPIEALKQMVYETIRVTCGVK